jgi:hypothetical protein
MVANVIYKSNDPEKGFVDIVSIVGKDVQIQFKDGSDIYAEGRSVTELSRIYILNIIEQQYIKKAIEILNGTYVPRKVRN